MSEVEEMPGPTKPTEHHEWLKKLLGKWRTESEMSMGPDQPKSKCEGTETFNSLGDLWAVGEGSATMPDGNPMDYRVVLGYDVSFNEYRGCWYANMSSHLWKYTGTLSEDGKKMTLECVGPHMMKDGETANYRDVIEFVDDNHRTLTSYGQDDGGEWQEFMHVHAYRI